MSDTNLERAALSVGALRWDERVNYSFGLVLGVDEFRQEQLYHLEGGRLHDRALHGYGTVHGLNVTAGDPDEDGDVLVTVTPGMAIDQWGRRVVVPTEQCVRVQAWLARQEAEKPGLLAGLPEGKTELYVVARASERLDRLVPVSGQPCSSGEEVQVASRIRDAWELELRWDKPEMPAFQAARRLADLLREVRIDPDAEGREGEKELLRRVVALADEEPPEDPPGERLRIPPEDARDVLDRVFARWATEVRPRLRPNLTDPRTGPGGDAEDAGVLLATLHLLPPEEEDGFDPESPRIGWFESDDTDRPVLLHTQLIHDLPLLWGAAPGRAPRGRGSARELVTITPLERRRFELWFHLHADTEGNEVQVVDPLPVQVYAEMDDSETREVQATTVQDRANVFIATLNARSWAAADNSPYLRFVFAALETQVRAGEDESQTLRDYLSEEGLRVHGDDGDEIVVHVRATPQEDIG